MRREIPSHDVIMRSASVNTENFKDGVFISVYHPRRQAM